MQVSAMAVLATHATKLDGWYSKQFLERTRKVAWVEITDMTRDLLDAVRGFFE